MNKKRRVHLRCQAFVRKKKKKTVGTTLEKRNFFPQNRITMERDGAFHERCHGTFIDRRLEKGEITNGKEFPTFCSEWGTSTIEVPWKFWMEFIEIFWSIWFPTEIFGFFVQMVSKPGLTLTSADNLLNIWFSTRIWIFDPMIVNK